MCLFGTKLNKGVKLSASSRMIGLLGRPIKWVGTAAMVAVIVACSGSPSSSDSGSGGGSGGAVTSTAASLTLLVSSPQMNSDGKTDVTFTVLAKDAGNAGVAGQPVQVTASSGSVVLDSATTDASGKATGKLSTIGDPANRVITLAATSGAATASNTVTVNGSNIQVSGTNSLVFGNTTELQVNVKDSAGTGVAKADLQVVSAKGNVLSSQSLKTDSSGAAKVLVTGTIAGTDTITLSALGTTKTFVLNVSASNFQFTAPAAGSSFAIGSPVVVSIRWEEGGVPQSNKSVNFSSTRGVITASAVTDVNGVASASINSSESGGAIITAAGSGGVPFNTLSVSFVATSAARVDVQSDKSNLAIFKANSLDSVSTISAIVRDSANNLVKNATVNFKLLSDPSGGVLSNSVATTDDSGFASVQYTAGAISSGQNAVNISASVTDVGGVPVGSAISSSVALTVGGQSLFVRLGSDNKTESSPPLNIKTYAAIVTDAAGNPVPNTTVQFSLRPATTMSAYLKGNWIPAGVNGWAQVVTASCDNEDLNFNGILDPAEDRNSNGMLTPGNVASVNKSATTDGSGIALAKVTYAKSYGAWASIRLRATIQVSGTEYTEYVEFPLSIIAEDYSDANISPPGRLSPFGVGSLCTDTL